MSDLTSQIELNDADILAIERVAFALEGKQGTMQNLEAFRREAIERFEDIGLKVMVKVFETDQPNLYAFDIDIVDRIFGQFDPEKMAEETVADVLELGEGGVITSTGVKEPKLKLFRKIMGNTKKPES